jgi:signal transduction histidine kinase
VRVEPAAGGRVSVEIADEGEPVADAAQLFEPVDAELPSDPNANMNELGLVIAHRLVAALAGTVEPVARVGRGLTLRVEIPARPPAPA